MKESVVLFLKNIYTIEDYKPHLRFVIFKGIAHEIYIRTLKGADINLRWSNDNKCFIFIV